MGIGVSYTGANGERKNFNVNNAGMLDSLMKSATPHRSMRGVQDALKMASPAMESSKAKTKSGSAVTNDFRGELCLRGEEADPLVEGKKFYGSMDGKKGYFTINEIDPPSEGKMCGEWLNISSSEDSASHDGSATSGCWTFPISRTVFTQSGEKVSVTNFYRKLIISGDGRLVGISGESSVLVGEFMAGGSGNSDFAVYPEFDDASGQLKSLKFGPSAKFTEAKITPLEDVVTIETTSACPLQEEPEEE